MMSGVSEVTRTHLSADDSQTLFAPFLSDLLQFLVSSPDKSGKALVKYPVLFFVE